MKTYDDVSVICSVTWAIMRYAWLILVGVFRLFETILIKLKIMKRREVREEAEVATTLVTHFHDSESEPII